MAIGIITGSGTYALPGFEGTGPDPVATPWGEAFVSRGRWADTEVLHVSRHQPGHVRLSSQVTHRANIAALKALGARAVLGVTVCGAVDPGLALGTLVCFDDLHFVVNRLPDGSVCSFFAPGDVGMPERREHAVGAPGHWIFEEPFSAGCRHALLEGAAASGRPAHDGGCYGHVDGPRFNSRAEIRGLAACGVTAVSQTAGPETALCGEAALPYALLGFLTDYANGVQPEPTPVATLQSMMASSGPVLAAALEHAVPRLAAAEPQPAGVVFRFS